MVMTAGQYLQRPRRHGPHVPIARHQNRHIKLFDREGFGTEDSKVEVQ